MQAQVFNSLIGEIVELDVRNIKNSQFKQKKQHVIGRIIAIHEGYITIDNFKRRSAKKYAGAHLASDGRAYRNYKNEQIVSGSIRLVISKARLFLPTAQSKEFSVSLRKDKRIVLPKTVCQSIPSLFDNKEFVINGPNTMCVKKLRKTADGRICLPKSSTASCSSAMVKLFIDKNYIKID